MSDPDAMLARMFETGRFAVCKGTFSRLVQDA